MLLLIPAAILLLVIFFTMRKETRRRKRTILSLTLHGIIALILAVLAAGFSVATETDRQSVVILMDVSDSTLSVREDMTATCEALLDGFSDRDVKGVVLFGQDAVFIGQKSPSGRVKLEKAGREGTDLAAALYEAVDLMDSYTHKRIILLSDGKETVGNALYAARRLGEEGVRMDTLYYDTDGQVQSEVQIRSMTTLGGSYVGDPLFVNVTLESNIQGEATVSIYEGDTLLETQAVTLEAGEQTLTFETTAAEAGMHGFRAEVDCGGDTEVKNNQVFAITQTYGAPSILIIAKKPAEAEALKTILSRDAEVTVVSQSQAPADLPTLCNYDGFYLMNTDVASLPAELGESLEMAVRVFGKSLCFVGGDQTFSKGNMEDTVYSQMLPLEFGARDGGGRIIIVIIDNSGSMDGDPIQLARVGAIKIMESLKPTDQFCVITFGGKTGAAVRVKLQYVLPENKESITKSISRIRAYEGTVYLPTLIAARNILSTVEGAPETKHIIYLSDGMPGDDLNDIYNETRLLREEGVTLSSIGTARSGDVEESFYVLRNMAKLGGGIFSFTQDPQDLPALMLGHSNNVSPQYAFLEPGPLRIGVEHSLTAPLAAAETRPTINGYVGMHEKEDATVYLTADNGDPIYAVREYGLGQVSCFTTDLTETWSGELLNSEVGQNFIRDALKDTFTEVRHDAALIPAVSVDGNRVTITAELPQAGKDFELLAEITGPERQKIQLERISDTVYEADTALNVPGEYTVTVTWKQRNKDVDQATAPFTVSYSGEYDLFREGGASLLSEIAAATGGVTDAEPTDLAAYDPGLLRSVTSFEIWLCLIAAVLMLLDIAVRRLSSADIRKLLRRRGS